MIASGVKATTIRLPADLIKRAKMAALARGVSLQALMADALERHLARRRRPMRK